MRGLMMGSGLALVARAQTAPPDGRVFLLTGGRVKIGYHVVLKLLRCGASVRV